MPRPNRLTRVLLESVPHGVTLLPDRRAVSASAGTEVNQLARRLGMGRALQPEGLYPAPHVIVFRSLNRDDQPVTRARRQAPGNKKPAFVLDEYR